MDEQFFGTQPGIPPYEEQPGDVDLAKTERIGADLRVGADHRVSPELIDDQIADQRCATSGPT